MIYQESYVYHIKDEYFIKVYSEPLTLSLIHI